MIAPLRRRHRRVMLGLAVLLPASFAIALASRPVLPIQAALPAGLDAEAPLADFAPELAAVRLSAELPFALVLGSTPTGARAVRVDSRGAPAVPDPLVYWSPGTVEGDGLPEPALLLGSVPEEAVRVLLLPAEAERAPGRVLVWSAGWSRVVAELAAP